MGFGGDAPPAPDYRGAAQEEAAASREINTAQTYANRPTTTTPWGTQSWTPSATTDPATGLPVTQWASNVSLSPDQQAALAAQQRIQSGRSQGAETLLGQSIAAFQQRPDWSSLPQRAESVGGLERSPSDYRDQAQEAVWQRMQPELQERRAGVETQLANQGLARGTEAWNREERNLADAEDRARLSSIESGRAEAAQMFGQDYQSGLFDISAGGFNNQNRQQAVSEQQIRRSQILNELNALLTGQQVANPQMPNFAPAGQSKTPDLLGAANSQYGASLDAFNAGQAGDASTMSGLFSLGAAALPLIFSDRRLKTNIKRVGTHVLGVGIYEFDYIWGEHSIGVMADEVEKVLPAAVHTRSGYKVVDYAML